ncbi:MAG: phosphodiester glycosidase family protein [Clostridia bacterium]|nr:phosphodiester glycosidase family protein [Clostridia bacterium]
MKRFRFFLCFLSLMAAVLLPVQQALAWETPCIGEPFDYSYADDRRAVCINRISENGLTYYVADIQLADASLWRSVYASDKKPLSQLVAQENAVFAINGDDYGTHRYGVIIRNGELLRTHDTTRHMLIVDGDGALRMVTDRKNNPPKALAEQLLAEEVWQAYEFGPALVENGQALDFPKAFDVISTRASRKEPRTAIGQIAPLHYCVIVADGRQPGYSDGISLQDLQRLFLDYGAQTAFNLDGGGSAELWFMGEVLNRPCGGHERSISDAICF